MSLKFTVKGQAEKNVLCLCLKQFMAFQTVLYSLTETETEIYIYNFVK